MPDDSLSANVSDDAAREQAVDAWLACQLEAEEWIAPGGILLDGPALRNRRISAAYASLWLLDQRFQWAGLAAFASRQVGFGMAQAGESMRTLGSHIRASGTHDSFEWLYKVMIPALVGAGEGYLRGQLSLGNLTVFLDVYPLHRFYALHGLQRLRDTFKARQLAADRVRWPVACSVLPFGQPFREIVDGFALVDDGRIADSVMKLAWHEQVNVLQRVIYDEPKTRLAFDANQIGATAGAWPERFAPIELVFDANHRTTFSPRQDAHLYDVGQRMDYVSRPAAQFDELVRTQPITVEAALRGIVGAAVLS